MTDRQGILYICATPIGNLEDMTYRAVRILQEADLIAAEDTRHSRKLLDHYGITTPLVSYHEHNKRERGPEMIDALAEGQQIAVISDAGMPGIADPGSHLVGLALAAGITVVPVPGANAALSALVASGLDTTVFTFVGFLPKTGKKRRDLLGQVASYPHTLIFYEAPHRLRNMLAELQAALGDRPAVAGRELTKRFEEFVRSTLGGLRDHYAERAPRGEYTILVAGAPENKAPAGATEEPLTVAVERLITSGLQKKDAIKKVASERGLAKRDVYNAVIAAKL